MNGNSGFKSLIYAARWRVLARLGGRLALVLAALCLPSLLVALWFGELEYVAPFVGILSPLLLMGWATRQLPEPQHLFRSEGFVLTCAAFILTPLLLSVALLPSGLPWQDIWFETVSAVTTTGLSTVPHPGLMNNTFLFTRAWMQWYGGLGVVVLSVTLLMQRSLASHQLLELPEGQGFVLAATAYARKIFRVYFILTVLAVAVCWLCFGSFFIGMLHGFSAVSTGGFSTRNESLAGLSFVAQLGVMLPCLAGAISLATYMRLRQRAWRSIWETEELRLFVGVVFAICVGLIAVQWLHNGRFLQAMQDGIVMGISAVTTTGFASLDLNELSPVAKLILLLAMFVGGCLGSTAGGFKIFRLLVVWKILLNTLRRASASPHAMITANIQGKELSDDQIQLVMLTGSLMIALIVLSWVPFLAYGNEPLSALFEVVSAVGTVGLSTGITQQGMPAVLKIVLCVDMIAGRVEIIALLCLMYPGVWFGHRNPSP